MGKAKEQKKESWYAVRQLAKRRYLADGHSQEEWREGRRTGKIKVDRGR